MSTPDQRARDKDRDAAIEVVEAAWAEGQIVEADRDKRVEELLRAQTLAEVRMLVHDLQPPAQAPAPASAPAPEPAPPPYATLEQVRAMKPQGATVSRAVFVVPLVVVVVVAVAIIGAIVALVGAIDATTEGGLIGSDEPADVLSVEGYADLLAAVEEETGSTIAFSAVLYPTYASVELPVDRTTQREEYWYWDGHELTNNDVKSTSSFARTDLSRVDPAVLVNLVEQVQTRLEDATTWYAIVRAPDDDRAVMWAYASNEYGESEYLGARRDGTITYDSTDY